MTTSNLFWKLVRHEFFSIGNRRKSAKRRITGKWWIVYIAALALIGFVLFTIGSGTKGFYMENIWYFTMGLPYIIFFMGHGLVKKEWDNETQGWWLTLPYSRNLLLGAKFFGSLFQVWVVLLGVYVVANIYAIYLTLIQSSITAQDFLHFMIVGVNWLFPLACVSPLIVSLGITTAVTPYTAIRPIVPLLWVLFMSMGSSIYWVIGDFNGDTQTFSQFVGGSSSDIFPYSLYTYGFMILCWILSFFIIRLLGFLLNKKLNL